MRWLFVLFLPLSVHVQAQIFSYPTPPVNCFNSNAVYYPSTDLNRCTIPGETPFSTFFVPAVGSSYIDANFGSTVTVLASFKDSGPGTVHGYYSPTAFSASGKYALISLNTFTRVVDAKTGALIQPFGQTMFGNVVSDTPTWDAFSDDFFWWWSGTKLSKYQVSTGIRADVLDFSTLIDQRTGRAFGFTSIAAGGTGDTSNDNWKAGFSDQAHHNACIVNLNNLHVYCADYTVTRNGVTPVTITSDGQNGSVFISKGVDSVSHKRYMMADTFNNYVFFSLMGDPNDGVLTFEELGPERSPASFGFYTTGNGNNVCDPGENCWAGEHEDMMQDADGQQYVVGIQTTQFGNGNNERRITYLRMNAGLLMGRMTSEVAGGGLTVGYLSEEGGGIDSFRDHHVGCAKSAPYCVVSSSNENPDGSVVSPTQPTFAHSGHSGAIIVVRGVNLEVRPIAYSRSPLFSYAGSGRDYWAYSRACISNDGTHVIFDSNLGHANGANNENVLVAPTGFGRPPRSFCDLDGDGSTNVSDAQIALNQVLGRAPCTSADITQSGTCRVIDIQRVVNAALTGVCRVGQ